MNRRSATNEGFSGPRFDDQNNQHQEAFPYLLQYVLALVFLLITGFIGTQKTIQVLSDPSSEVNFGSINESICSSGLRLSFLNCETKTVKIEDPEAAIEPIADTPKIEIENKVSTQSTSLIKEMDLSDNTPSLREQFARLPNLTAALNKLQWNDGDEQEAVRLLTLISTLTYGRQREAHLVQSADTRLLGSVWNSYPDLVAASHCLYCGMFFNNVLQPYMSEGSENREHLNAIATGHPRFLKALYDSGQLELNDIKSIAKLQAELSSSGDAGTAKFIGDILIKNNEIELLRNWSTKGLNGSYSFSDHKLLTTLPRDLIIDAWQRTVLIGYDNAVLTRYLISTGHRPALRWLLWYHSGDLSYFKKQQHQHQRDRYNNFLTREYIELPKESHSDLAGFYSNNWKEINWNESKGKWIYQQKNNKDI